MNILNIIEEEIEKAIGDSNDKDNESFAYYVLCEMCKREPRHTKTGVVRDKILMIGRTYAAALERRTNEEKETIDDFYENRVLPIIIDSDIDKWFHSLKKFEKIDDTSIPSILQVHFNLVKLFRTITGMYKRSLASKYLHFHFPSLFFLYDNRARKGLGVIMPRHRASREKTGRYDNDYENFALKLLDLQQEIGEVYKKTLTPHQLDVLLLRKGGTK